MKIEHLDEGVGRIIKGVNTTVDVGVDQTRIEAAKFGNTVDKDGRPPVMRTPIKEQPRYTASEWAIIEGGHSLEDLKPTVKKPGRMFEALNDMATVSETIRKIGDNKWRLYSKDGSKNLGTFNSLEAAKKHEREVQYFKHNEDQHPNETLERLFASLTEGYKLQLERDKNVLVLHIKDTATGKRTEVRGKPGYETDGYNAKDPLHKLLDIIGKSANISELMNGEVVTINPKHPDADRAKAATDKAYSEAFDTDTDWVLDMDSGGIQVFATKVEDAYIELTYKRMANDDVYIAFSRGGRSSVTGEGNQNKIFGAVINHIQKWVNANKPTRIVFSAFKPNTGAFGAQDTTRSSLYRKMVQRFASQNGYEYDVEDTGNEDTFILTRQNVEENFADGKNPGRKGLAKRSGVNTKASVSSLRKTAKNSSGEKQRMAHWLANMKAGRAKKK